MNRWDISLYQLRRDLVNEQYKQEQEEQKKQEVKKAIEIMDSYAELYEVQDI